MSPTVMVYDYHWQPYSSYYGYYILSITETVIVDITSIFSGSIKATTCILDLVIGCLCFNVQSWRPYLYTNYLLM